MHALEYVIAGAVLGAVVVVLATLAFGPAYLALRDWLRKGGHW